MAPQLCCTAEDESRSGSPLPNARVSDATTPAKRPLIPKRTPSHGSRFTSARSEDLHELRQIFDNAKDQDSTENSPKNRGPMHFKRPSVYSLHSLHKVKSMQAFIKRKLSRDLSKGPSPQLRDKGKKVENDFEPDTVVKLPMDGPNLQLRITKEDLRKDLLSDKKPQEGGYDSDAEVLDDIAKNIGRRSPSKRPSLHSIDWTSSPENKHTNATSAKEQSNATSPEQQDSQVQHSYLNSRTPIAAMFSQFTSSPNLRVGNLDRKEQKLRRSHSATSIRISRSSSLLPVCLPNITSNEDMPWSAGMHESLRLSRFPVPPSPELSKTSPSKGTAVNTHGTGPMIDPSEKSNSTKPPPRQEHQATSSLQIHVQQPTSAHSPSSVKEREKTAKQNTPPEEPPEIKDSGDVEGPNSARNSVHLYSMRISHHLRSGSLLSWDALAADAPDMPTPPTGFYNRNVSNTSNFSHAHQTSRARRQRQSSSSGFASSKVPSKWGRVLHSEHNLRNDRDLAEDKSSIYSSRPQSPPDSFFASVSRGNLSTSVSHFESTMTTTTSLPKSNTVTFNQTDDEDTPRPKRRYGFTNREAAEGPSSNDKLVPAPLARNNSVADTKKSKFREEFSPSPPKKKIIPSASIMQFLRPKKSVRSRSDTSLGLSSKMDGPCDGLLPGRHERRLSKSMISLQAEQAALGNDRDAIPMWERALKAHQEERASMFLPGNKALAVRGSPFRERRGSVGKPPSIHSTEEPESPKQANKRLSLPVVHMDQQVANPFMRRSALIHSPGSASPGQPVPVDFHKQADNIEAVGAWGRYPSHTREERTASAGKADDVQSRDFALEKAIQFAMGDEEIDPIARIETSPLPSGKKRKKRAGPRMAKSHSMTFGRTFLKNYARIFRSQSTEFRRHGHGHRSSITAGGVLQFPELELLPDVFHRDIAEEQARGSLHGHHTTLNDGSADEKGRKRADDSQATLRARQHSNSDPGKRSFDGCNDTNTPDKARVWSVYYEDCMPDFPRASFDAAFELQDFLPRRLSSSSRKPPRQVSVHSKTLPARLTHSRARSRLSKVSIVSGVPSFEDGGGIDGRSIVSVRRSTLDLIQLYRNQEVTEREKVLNMVRMESRKESGGIRVDSGA